MLEQHASYMCEYRKYKPGNLHSSHIRKQGTLSRTSDHLVWWHQYSGPRDRPDLGGGALRANPI